MHIHNYKLVNCYCPALNHSLKQENVYPVMPCIKCLIQVHNLTKAQAMTIIIMYTNCDT